MHRACILLAGSYAVRRRTVTSCAFVTQRLDLVLWFLNAGLRFVAAWVISGNVKIRFTMFFFSFPCMRR